MTAPNDNGRYDRKTLVTAALLLVGFGALVYFLPPLMLMLGGNNRWIAGAVLAAVLVLPFAGLWLRGRYRRKRD
ncbi:hypothetical protein [Oricola cellulosilytica]|uniref:hypothetical protein n=1 Tax=Oricola cellulosilytica TaxID=1429082 RepID=UPI00104048CD|nr:hypothetical protein [Oricola cellulosilytica]